MPAGNLVSFPTSLSREGKTVINLRGILGTGNSAYDYITPSYFSNTTNDIDQSATALLSNSGPWTSTVFWAYGTRTSSPSPSPSITFTTLLSSETSFTLMFRVLFLSGAPFSGIVLQNGDTDLNSGFAIQTNFFNNRLFFYIFENVSYNFQSISLNLSLSQNQWYHYAIRVTTDRGNTTVDWWENGVKASQVSLGWEYVAPIGTTTFFNNASNSYPFYGKLTDFTFLKGVDLTDNQIASFATAPFV